MTELLVEHVEVKRDDFWRRISVASALADRDAGRRNLLRCQECHGQVFVHKESSVGQEHFEHLVANRHCSQKPGFIKPAKKHPQAID